MAQTRVIRTKIASIRKTQKITRAMGLVAISKLRRAMERMQAAKPYADKMRQVIAHVAHSHSEYQHPYLKNRETVARVGFIVVSTDRGLCGGLNINLFRMLLQSMKDWHGKQVEIDLCLIGHKAAGFFKQVGGRIVATAEYLGDKPSVTDLVGAVRVMINAFDQGQLDRVFLVSNEFVNTMSQTPHIQQLLPLPKIEESAAAKGHWDYLYEPDSARELMEKLLVRYIESQVYQGVVENFACEQAARMVAMKSASDNAGQLIDELQLIYNKVRQAGITQEIAEIVSGAAAIQ